MSSVKSEFDNTSWAQLSSRATSFASGVYLSPSTKEPKPNALTGSSSRKNCLSSCFTFSPQAKEFQPAPRSVLEIDPAIVQHPRKGKAGPICEPSGADGEFRLFHKTSNRSLTLIEKSKPTVPSPDEIDPAIVRLSTKDTTNGIPKPSAADAAFFIQLLNKGSQPEQSSRPLVTIAEKCPHTAPWDDQRVENVDSLCTALDLENNRRISKVQLPLDELCLGASESQILGNLDYVSRHGAAYEETVTNAEFLGEEDAPVTLCTPLPARQNLRRIEHVLRDFEVSPSSPCNDTTSPALTPATTPSESEAENIPLRPAEYLDCAGNLAKDSKKPALLWLAWLNLIESYDLDDLDLKLEDVDWPRQQHRTSPKPKARGLLENADPVDECHHNDTRSAEDTEKGKENGSDDTMITMEDSEVLYTGQGHVEVVLSPQLESPGGVAEGELANHFLGGDETNVPDATGELVYVELTKPSPSLIEVRDDDEPVDAATDGGDILHLDDSDDQGSDILDLHHFPTLKINEGRQASSAGSNTQTFPFEDEADAEESPASKNAASHVYSEDFVENQEVQSPCTKNPVNNSASLLGMAGENDPQEFNAPYNTLHEQLESVFGEFSGDWADNEELQMAPIVEPAAQMVLLPSHTTATMSPPCVRLPVIPCQWLDLFKVEEFKIWRDGTSTGSHVLGRDDSTVAMLAQAALEATFEDVPEDVYQIADISRTFYNMLWEEGHPRYGPFMPGVCTNGEVEDTAYIGKLAIQNVQWKLLSDNLHTTLSWNRPTLQGVEPEKLDMYQPDLRGSGGSNVHHINFNGDHVYERSYTPPPVSLWAISTTMWKHPFPDMEHCAIVHMKTVLMSQAFKYVDPVKYLGGDASLPTELVHGQTNYLHGSHLRNAVTCDVEAIYQPYGAWREDQYDQEDKAPVMWRKGDQYHDGQMTEYIYLQRPYFVNPRHNEHNLCNINDDSFPKPRSKPKALKRRNGCSPLWREQSNETGEMEVSFTRHGTMWHGILIRKDLGAEEISNAVVLCEEAASSSEAETEVEDNPHNQPLSRMEQRLSSTFDLSKVTQDPFTWPPPKQWPEHWPKPNMGYSKALGWSPYVSAAEAKDSLLKKLSAAIGEPYLGNKPLEQPVGDDSDDAGACHASPPAPPAKDGRQVAASKMFYGRGVKEDVVIAAQILGSWEIDWYGVFVSQAETSIGAYSRQAAQMLDQIDVPMVSPMRKNMLDGFLVSNHTASENMSPNTIGEAGEDGGDSMATKQVANDHTEGPSPSRSTFNLTLIEGESELDPFSPLQAPGQTVVKRAPEFKLNVLNDENSSYTTNKSNTDEHIMSSAPATTDELGLQASARAIGCMISSADLAFPDADDEDHDYLARDETLRMRAIESEPQQLPMEIEDPFEDEGCFFTYRTKCELAYLQAARLSGVDVPWGERFGEDETESGTVEEEADVETLEQGSVNEEVDMDEPDVPKLQIITKRREARQNSSLESSSSTETMIELARPAPFVTTGRSVMDWLDGFEEDSDADAGEIEKLADYGETVEKRDRKDGDKNIRAAGIGLRVTSLYNGCQQQHGLVSAQSPETGYSGRHFVAAIILALVVGLLWG
ncbi:MAG: hypothetical protein Q9217_002825 [Psora testacea]